MIAEGIRDAKTLLASLPGFVTRDRGWGVGVGIRDGRGQGETLGGVFVLLPWKLELPIQHLPR